MFWPLPDFSLHFASQYFSHFLYMYDGADIVMIVQCPSCASRYRVNEANIPSSGGRIRCPSCDHAFVVYPQNLPAFEDDEDDKTSVIMSPNLREMMENLPGANKQPAAPAMAEEEESMTEVMDSSDISAFVDEHADRFNAQSAPMAEDHTIEMESPLDLSRDLFKLAGTAPNPSNEASTTELSSDALRKGLQAAAAARQAAAANAPAPPPMPRSLSSRLPVVSKELPAANRPGQSTPHALPSSLQKLGQKADASPRANDALNTAVLPPQNSFAAPKPAPPRSFGEEPIAPGPVTVPTQNPQNNQPASPAPNDQNDTGVSLIAPVMISDEPDPDHVGPWHLRTNFGLTYEFPDTKGLRSWLSNRDELDGLLLSTNGEQFYELSRFPQVQSPYRTGARPAVNDAAAPSDLPSNPVLATTPPQAGFGGPQRLSSTPFSTADGQNAALNTGFAPAAGGATAFDPNTRINPQANTSSGSSSSGLLWGVFGVLLLVALALVLQTLNVVDFKSMIFGAPPAAESEQVAEVAPPAEPEPDPEAELRAQQAAQIREARRRDQFERILAAAVQDIEANRLQVASEKLITARTIDPENIQLHELLVDVHTRLGQTKLAEEASESLARLRGQAVPPAGD